MNRIRASLADLSAAFRQARDEGRMLRAEKLLLRAATVASPHHPDGRRLIDAVSDYAKQSICQSQLYVAKIRQDDGSATVRIEERSGQFRDLHFKTDLKAAKYVRRHYGYRMSAVV